MFSGGEETNDFLSALRFVIAPGKSRHRPTKAVVTTLANCPRIASKVRPTGTKHTERCPKCKVNIERLLVALYGSVKKNPKVDVPTTPDAYTATSRPPLSKVYSALQTHRGFSSFVRSSTLPRCDFFIPTPGFLLEFDESQHFTKCRWLALTLYPDSLPLGFPLSKWMESCEEIDCHDNTPPDRDEQRAWYDSLRDFLPWTKAMLPTIRLRADEQKWCDFDPTKLDDLDSFRQVLGERASFWKIGFDVPKESLLARLAIDGDWRGEMVVARKLISDVCKKWPSGLKVLCLSTCGAFLRMKWPCDVAEQTDNFNPHIDAVLQIELCGRAVCESLLGGGLREQLSKYADFLTVGVDTEKSLISTTRNWISNPHAELVYVVNLKNGEIHFTGKSYPTLRQERGLLRIADLDSHFVEMNNATVVVLGCHDLTIFNHRSDSVVKQKQRVAIKKQFKSQCDARKPSIVLHHPHTSVKVGTWRGGWSGVRGRVPTVRSFLGTGCYSHKDDGWGRRNPLSNVLNSTKSEDVVDIVVQMAGLPS